METLSLFHAGIYDWSDAPMSERAENKGAINIIDKTLTITGGIGQDLSEAVKERNEELKEARKIKF